VTKEFDQVVNTRYSRVAFLLEKVNCLTQPLSYDRIKVKFSSEGDWIVLSHNDAIALATKMRRVRLDSIKQLVQMVQNEITK